MLCYTGWLKHAFGCLYAGSVSAWEPLQHLRAKDTLLPSSLCVKSAANNKTDKPWVRVCVRVWQHAWWPSRGLPTNVLSTKLKQQKKTLICKHWWCYQRLAENLIMNQCQTGDLSRPHPACRHMAAGLPPLPPPKYRWHQRDITRLKWKWIQFGFFNEWYETASFGIKFGNIFDLFNDPRFSYKLFAANYQTSSRLPSFCKYDL